jgi:hypothetical protein
MVTAMAYAVPTTLESRRDGLLRVAVRLLTRVHSAAGLRMHLPASATGAVSMSLLAAPFGGARPPSL